MDKEFRTRIEGELSIARWKTRLRAGVENIKNYTYFNQQATPEQKSGSLSSIIGKPQPGLQAGNLPFR